MKKSINKLFFYCVLMACLLPSCKNSFRSNAEVQRYISDSGNDLSSSFQAGDVTIRLLWQPSQIIEGRLSNSQKKNQELNKYYFFILSFSKSNKELLRQLDYNTYSKMIQIFSFRMKENISIISSNNKHISPVDCLFQQTYGASDSNKILLVFAKSDVGSLTDLKLLVKEFGLGLGNIDFYLKTKNMALFNELKF